MSRIGGRMRRLLARIALALVVLSQPASAANDADTPTLPARDAALIAAQVRALPAQVPGRVDLYVVGVAGDGNESVFRNEIEHLQRLVSTRLKGGSIALVNHADSFSARPLPLATPDNLRLALRGVASVMDPREDLLWVFVTSHGSPDAQVALDLFPVVAGGLSATALRSALDGSGIDHRVVVVSACFSGAFIPALRDPDTLVITAARRDRTSFGCGSDSDITYFGRAFLVDGLNATPDFRLAFRAAQRDVATLERAEEYDPSLPQLRTGRRIDRILDAWLRTLTVGPAVAFDPPAMPTSEPAVKTAEQ